MDMTTYLVRVLYSSTTLPIYQVFGTRHPDTDPSNVTRVLFFVRNVRRRKASSSWVSDLHVRAPRSLEAKPEGLAGGRSPAGTVGRGSGKEKRGVGDTGGQARSGLEEGWIRIQEGVV